MGREPTLSVIASAEKRSVLGDRVRRLLCLGQGRRSPPADQAGGLCLCATRRLPVVATLITGNDPASPRLHGRLAATQDAHGGELRQFGGPVDVPVLSRLFAGFLSGWTAFYWGTRATMIVRPCFVPTLPYSSSVEHVMMVS